MTKWSRSETIALAQQSCASCFGIGMKPGRAGHLSPCNCVFRAIFRACYEHFRVLAVQEKSISRVSLNTNAGNSKNSWSLKDEEYVADFCLVSKRTLTSLQHDVFRFHFLLGTDWKFCCRRLNIDRGTFFHEVYRIQQRLGRVFRELEPHALFPIDEYFHGAPRRKDADESHPIFALETAGEEDRAVERRKQTKMDRAQAFPLKAASSGD